MPPELIQSALPSFDLAAAAVGADGVLAMLAGVAELARDDTRAVTVEATQMKSGAVELAVVPRRVSIYRMAA